MDPFGRHGAGLGARRRRSVRALALLPPLPVRTGRVDIPRRRYERGAARLRTLLPGAPTTEDDESVASWLGTYFERAVATEVFGALDEGGVPIEVVDEHFCRDIFDDPEAKQLNLVSETWSSSVGRFEDPGLLVNIRPAEPVIQRGPCACGEQTREILLELGYSDAQIDGMVDSRAVLDGAK